MQMDSGLSKKYSGSDEAHERIFADQQKRASRPDAGYIRNDDRTDSGIYDQRRSYQKNRINQKCKIYQELSTGVILP
jgi:hypothetical protein